MIYQQPNTPQMLRSTLSPQSTFTEAFELWLPTRIIDVGTVHTNVRYISPRAAQDLRQYARAAGKYFGPMRLDKIRAGHFQEYQKARALCDREHGDWAKPAGANLIRKEVAVVVRVLRAAGRWNAELEQGFELVQPAETDICRVMSPQEQSAWVQTAASREKWRVVYWWSLIALQTTMSTNEMRALRIGDIFLEQGTLQVRNEGAKNKFRLRTIPLQTPEAIWALRSLIERAQARGARSPHHYVFPFHITRDLYNPERPMTAWGLRKPWDAIREATGLTWLRIYDLRHTAITRMAEAGVPIQVIMSFAGHISPKMQQHYTAISMEAKRRWAATAWGNTQAPLPTPRRRVAPARQDWHQQASAAGWAPNTPQPFPETPAWQKQAMAEGWIAPAQQPTAVNF